MCAVSLRARNRALITGHSLSPARLTMDDECSTVPTCLPVARIPLELSEREAERRAGAIKRELIEERAESLGGYRTRD